jgi:ribosomal protein S18 acetylase RimI-like enzyme
MCGQLHIRDYQPSDNAMLLELLKLNIPKYFAESELADLAYYLENETENYFVVEIASEIIGAGGINFDNSYKTAKISWDFIHPKFHKQGIGQKLLKHRIDFLNAIEGVEKITVRTSQLAYLFYEKQGFIVNDIVKDYWAKGFDLYNMTYK